MITIRIAVASDDGGVWKISERNFLIEIFNMYIT